jgi:allantoicase
MALFTELTDLASRTLAGSVVCANDELFAERENLIRPGSATHSVEDFGHKGKVYDGWETRRRREPGHDWAVVRLGAAGIVRGVVVDTAYFKGNYPPEVSVEATSVEGYPSPDELLTATWVSLVDKTAAQGDTANEYEVHNRGRWTHVRLSIYPDGGVARFRVHGVVVPDPRFLEGTIDLVALENGGHLLETSDAYYSSPGNLILPGRARMMGEGWENARRRGEGNDFAVFALAARGHLRHVEVDTSYFVGNAPGWVKVSGADETVCPINDESGWWDVVPRTRVQPDTRHRHLVASQTPATHIRLDVYPDGGLTRLRCHGEVAEDTLAALRQLWWDLLPTSHQASLGSYPWA